MAEAKKYQIRIESILGGESPVGFFAAPNQFKSSLGIDPGLPTSPSFSLSSSIASGLLRPTGSELISGSGHGTAINNIPMWIVGNPRSSTANTDFLVSDAQGSMYTMGAVAGVYTFAGISDGGTETGTGTGNGAAYYDNYIYFAKDTTIARYGPLNGSATLNGDYWGTTLSKAALTNTTYPSKTNPVVKFPNHVLKRHSDGRLYIADVVGNQGTLHYISTTKTTVEGDTDNGSKANALTFGYGLWPTAIESYSQNLVIALYEGGQTSGTESTGRAKIGFWDTTSQNANSIVWNEFPDEIITGMKNINGVLYVASGNVSQRGCRISQYVGGYTFKEVLYLEQSESPLSGAMDGKADRLVFGSYTLTPETAGCVFSLGLQKSSLSKGLFNIMRVTQTSAGVTALILGGVSNQFLFDTPLIGWSTGSTHGFNAQSANYDFSQAAQVWWSQSFRIGTPFKITKIRIPLADTLTSGSIITPSVWLDGGSATKPLTAITSAKYGLNTQSVVIRPQNLAGDNDFWLELRWTGADLTVVSLPITIEYELLDVDTAYP